MKLSCALVAICAWSVSAFAPNTPQTASSSAIHSSSTGDIPIVTPGLPVTRIEGVDTLRTYEVPASANRAEIMMKTNGRPLRALVELWLGPMRRLHRMEADIQDGNIHPLRYAVGFKNIGKTMKISGKGSMEFPIDVSFNIPEPERMAELAAFTEKTFNENERHLIQGGPNTHASPAPTGAVRSFPIDSSIDAVQLILWSTNVGKRTCKCHIELLRGPNNMKQRIDLHCGGSTQPFHAVFETPGNEEWTLRLFNKNFLEFPFEAVLIPYDASLLQPQPVGTRPKKEWWE